MKVVLLHDWLTGFRGGERVLEAFCEMFPDAPIYTLLHKKGSVPASIEDRKVVTSFLDGIPGIYQHYRKFFPLFPLAADSLKIKEKADLILSSSHCVIKGVEKPGGARHLSYIHSPMRYLYDQYDHYFGQDSPFYQRLGMKIFRKTLTQWDLSSNENVDLMVANANFVRQRIRKYYERDSDTVHPFVDLAHFRDWMQDPPAKENFYLMVSALAPNKRVDLAIEAFNKLQKPLKIIGSGQRENDLKNRAKENIQFLGQQNRREVISYFFKAKGFIFPGVEDFGITPLEALAAGTPVIARKKGGVLETMTSKTAVFFERSTVDDLVAAVQSFEEKSFERRELRKRAEEFSKERFKKNIEEKIKKVMNR